MKRVSFATGSVAVALVVLAPCAAPLADPLEDAMVAYEHDDYATASSLWRALAEQGDARAQVNLGFLHANGHGVAFDYAEAVRWYERGAAQGDALGQWSLGFAYAHGLGVDRDPVRAHAWLRLAVAGSTGALHALFVSDRDLVAQRMDGQQLAAAERLARELEARVRSPQAARP